MARCQICLSPARLEIDRKLASGRVNMSALAREHNVSYRMIHWHRKNCLSRQMVAAVAMKTEQENTDLSGDLLDLLRRAQGILDTAEADGKLSIALKAVAESRNTISTLAEIASMLKSAQVDNSLSEQEEKLDRLSLTERRRMLRLVRKMEGRPIDGDSDYSFDDWDLEATGGNGKPRRKRRQKIEKEDSDADSEQDSDSNDSDESEEEDTPGELDFETGKFPSDADFDDPEGYSLNERMKRRPRHEIADAHLLDMQRERRRWEKRKKISKSDPSGFLDAVMNGKAKARTLL